MWSGLTEAQFPFLAEVTDDARRALAALAVARAIPGARLLRRGERANGAYFVVGGALRVYYISAEGREATLYRVEPGSTCVLSLTSTFDRAPFPAWVDAGPRGGDYVRMPSDTLHRLVDSEGAFRRYVLGVLSGRVFELMCALEELGSSQIEQRVARYLLRRCEPDDCVRISQVGIASELGSAREVVFRALRSLAQRKLVQTGRMRIRIVDRRGLTLVAADQVSRRGREAVAAGSALDPAASSSRSGR
jgi:CRP/FNR family transcriptional regulator, anaerobic regulatory protein